MKLFQRGILRNQITIVVQKVPHVVVCHFGTPLERKTGNVHVQGKITLFSSMANAMKLRIISVVFGVHF